MTVSKPRIVVQDANLLLMYFAGRVDPSLLGRWKRVSLFDTEDLSLLNPLLLTFSSQQTTPHILAEVSNFIDQSPPYRRAELIAEFENFACQWPETYEQASILVLRPEFRALALTDTGLVSISKLAVVLTVDFHLAARIAASGGHTINFNHLRNQLI